MVSKKDVIKNFIGCLVDAALFATTGSHSGYCFRKTTENIVEIVSEFIDGKETDSNDDFCRNIDLYRYWYDEEYRNEVHNRCGCKIVWVDEQQQSREPLVVDLRPKRDEVDHYRFFRYYGSYEYNWPFKRTKENQDWLYSYEVTSDDLLQLKKDFREIHGIHRQGRKLIFC